MLLQTQRDGQCLDPHEHTMSVCTKAHFRYEDWRWKHYVGKKRKDLNVPLQTKASWWQLCCDDKVHTFDFFPQLAAFVLWVVNDGRWGRWTQTVLLYPAPVSFFSRQHALPALPLVQVVSGLSVVHVQPTRVLLIRAGAETDPVTCAGIRKSTVFISAECQSMLQCQLLSGGRTCMSRHCNEYKRHISWNF